MMGSSWLDQCYGEAHKQARVELRKSGIAVVGDVPWGTHLCQFYQTREDLLDVLVPYFKAGLENNEFCMWITSEPLKVEDAWASLRKAITNLEDYLRNGQIEIFDYAQWYARSGRFEPSRVLQGWVEKETRAVNRGFDGLRLSGNTFWLQKKDWRDFADYEAAVDNLIGKYRMIALCSYSLDRSGASEIIDVMTAHRLALIRREGKWEVVESAEHKRMEDALQESQEQFRELLEASKDAISVNIETKLVYLNKSCAELLGFSDPSQLVGRDFLEFVAPEDREMVKTRSLAREGGEEVPALYEFKIQRKDGTTVPVETHATVIKYQGKRATLSFRRDITERKRTEEELRRYSASLEQLVAERTGKLAQSERRFRELVDLLPQIVFEIDDKDNLTFLNQTGMTSTGYGEDDLRRGLSAFQMFAPQEHDRAREKMRNLLAGEKVSSDEYTVVRKDRSTFPAIVYAAPVVVENRTVGVRGVVCDIIERQGIQKERLGLQAAKTNFITSATHELKTPLVSIKGYTDLVLSGSLGEVPAWLRNSLEPISRNAERMLRLISDLMDLQRLDTAMLKLAMENLDLAEVVRESIEDILLVVKGKKQQLESEVPNAVLKVYGDKVRLGQVMLNLLSNSTKFTPEGGKITVAVSQEADRFRVSVSDTGIGIEEDYLPQLFEPFFKIPKTIHVEGTGLGLSVAKRLVKMHGGEISAESEGEGKGATFTFTIPKA